MRVRASGIKPPPEGREVQLMLQALDKPIPVYARVSWVKRVGLFKSEIGLKFININDELRASLVQLARSVAHNEVIRPSIAADRKKP